MTSNKQVRFEGAVWVGKPYIVPAVVFRTISVIIVAIIFLVLESFFGAFSYGLIGLPLWLWTILLFAVAWLFSVFDLLILRWSNTYIQRQDGIEVRRGIISLRSFVVTPEGFGDLLVYQSIGGRIFGYGDITVNSQGERQTTLKLVRNPFKIADTMRDIMGKPIVRVDSSSHV